MLTLAASALAGVDSAGGDFIEDADALRSRGTGSYSSFFLSDGNGSLLQFRTDLSLMSDAAAATCCVLLVQVLLTMTGGATATK